MEPPNGIKGTEVSALTSFDNFSQLPQELQDLIWRKAALHDVRILEVHWDPEHLITFHALPDSLQLVSKRARKETRKYYRRETIRLRSKRKLYPMTNSPEESTDV